MINFELKLIEGLVYHIWGFFFFICPIHFLVLISPQYALYIWLAALIIEICLRRTITAMTTMHNDFYNMN